MSVDYRIIKTDISLDGTDFDAYGIAAVDKLTAAVLLEIVDISPDDDFVKSVAELLNSCEVEPCHFFEIVSDELNR